MDLDGRTRQFFSVLSERLKEKASPHELPMTDAWQ